MLSKKGMLVALFIVGFLTKVVAEFVHEVLGHGLFVLLFGGRIESVYISILWPYDFSYICYALPNNVVPVQEAWIYVSGILVCAVVSFLVQSFLFLRKKAPLYFSFTSFWFAFWTFANSTGYLIIGGLAPYGDIQQLIALGVLTNLHSLFIGLFAFILGFFGLSWILRRILNGLFTPKKASLSVTSFWLIIPVVVAVMFVNPGRGLQLAYLPLAFIPAFASFVMEYFVVLSKQKANKNPDNIPK